MKIPNLSTKIKTTLGIGAVASVMAYPIIPVKDNSKIMADVYETEKAIMAQPSIKSKVVRWYTKAFSDNIVIPPASGSTADEVLAFAPNPHVVVKNRDRIAKFVVDVTNNVLYHYDAKGNPIAGYLIASGKKSSPTNTGVRVISHVETYPYDRAPVGTKRRAKPWNYGPKVIILNGVDPETGMVFSQGEFIHGNNNPKSIGKFVSLGCMRMDNDVIKKLAKAVKRGDIVRIIRP